MGGADLPVEVLVERLVRARAHGRGSIERRPRRFNAKTVVLGVLLAATAAAVEVPGAGGRLTAGGYVDGLAVAETEGGKRERPQALLDVHLDGTAARWLRGRLEIRERVGGPFEGGSGAGLYDWSHIYQNRSPSTEVSEAFADVHLRRADLRVGVQKMAWGKLDGIPPTDIVNPRDYHDPLVQDFEERKAQLSQRVVLIEDLRKEQKGPVHMLDEISKALPPMLWLTEVKQVAAAGAPRGAAAAASADVIIDGNSTTQTGVSDFVNNLEASGYFKKSIDIVGTRTLPLPGPPGELVSFSLRARFLTPGEAKPAAAAAPAPKR